MASPQWEWGRVLLYLLKICGQKGASNHRAEGGMVLANHLCHRTQAESGPGWAQQQLSLGDSPFSVSTQLLVRFPRQVKYLSTPLPQPRKLADVGRQFISFVPLTLDFKEADSKFILL